MWRTELECRLVKGCSGKAVWDLESMWQGKPSKGSRQLVEQEWQQEAPCCHCHRVRWGRGCFGRCLTPPASGPCGPGGQGYFWDFALHHPHIALSSTLPLPHLLATILVHHSASCSVAAVIKEKQAGKMHGVAEATLMRPGNCRHIDAPGCRALW